MRRASVLATLMVAAAVLAAPADAAKAPPEFFGIVPQATPSKADLARMRGTVDVLRMPIFWFECEPERGRYDFATVDGVIGAAAARGIELLPFVYGTPAWLGRQERPPLNGEALARWKGFLRVLVARYGPGGSFWRGRARREPIRRWQIWNEPNFRLYWAPRIEPAGYARLLRAAATAIRGADPAARVVLAGVAPVGYGMKTWVFIRRLLRVPGVRRDFDFAAIHPYAATIAELDYQLGKVRAAMAAGGAARKPLIVTEFGVASHADYPSAFVEGEEGQARFLRDAFERLLAMRHRWRIAGAYWYAWQDEASADPHCSFCQGAGLLRLDGTPKPAWFAYRRLTIAARTRRAARAPRRRAVELAPGPSDHGAKPPVFLTPSHHSRLCCGANLSLCERKAPQPQGGCRWAEKS
ncbi:MAG TPA: glycosyl hydrolase [Solirubrobacterales bacterium]|nr:glycosyl hydrolase [Solirubrobacterales bacterium]